MSFPSTLYLCPVLDLLLVSVPPEWQAEIRLGLQEALVNAAKHGNQLDPSKTIIVRFTVTPRKYSWVIADEGSGFAQKQDHFNNQDHCHTQLPKEEAENGRGLSILHQVFDYVHWNREGTQLTLSKELYNLKPKQPSIC